MFNVKVYNDEYLIEAAKAIEKSEESLAQVLAEAAYFHATKTMSELPEQLKGKIGVSVMYTGEGELEALVSYQMKAGPEGATTQLGRMFLPLDKLSGASSRRPVVSKTSGEQGIFVSAIRTTGRPSIQSYLMSEARKAVDIANGVTMEVAVGMARQALLDWFTANGVVYHSSTGRFQATQAITMPYGEEVPGGRFIVGDF